MKAPARDLEEVFFRQVACGARQRRRELFMKHRLRIFITKITILSGALLLFMFTPSSVLAASPNDTTSGDTNSASSAASSSSTNPSSSTNNTQPTNDSSNSGDNSSTGSSGSGSGSGASTSPTSSTPDPPEILILTIQQLVYGKMATTHGTQLLDKQAL